MGFTPPTPAVTRARASSTVDHLRRSATAAGCRVVDAAAFSLCQENKLPMLVFAAEGEDTIARAVAGGDDRHPDNG